MLLEIDLVEVSMTEMGMALLLKPVKKEMIVPIFIGPLEAYSISIALDGQKRERPMAHDLMKTMISRLNHEIERVVIRDFKSGIYYATVYLVAKKGSGAKSMRIDARPSDGVALALRFNAPVYIQDRVYTKTAQPMDEIKNMNYDSDMSDEFFRTVEEALDDMGLDDSGDSRDDIIKEMLDDYDMLEDHSYQEYDDIFETFDERSKRPLRKKDERKYQSREEVLNQMIEVAISREKYEDAAMLRDELLELNPSYRTQALREKEKTENKKSE